jgi:hypothetical protein
LVGIVLIQVALDLEFLLSDSCRFVPVQLCTANCAIRQPNPRNAFALSPAAMAVLPAEAPQFMNLSADGERLDVSDLPEDREIHR